MEADRVYRGSSTVGLDVARGKAHSEEVRAQVMAALLLGQGVTEVAEQFGVPERTVRLWREGEIAEVCRQKEDRIANAVLDYVGELFITLKEQATVFRDSDYLKKQSAAENATLHGVLADKGFRALDSLARLEGDGEQPEAEE